jgi:hypothetical protein
LLNRASSWFDSPGMRRSRLIALVAAAVVVAFAAAFAIGRANRPAAAAAAPHEVSWTRLPDAGSPPAIPLLARADALPQMRVKRKPKRKPKRVVNNVASASQTVATATTTVVPQATTAPVAQPQTPVTRTTSPTHSTSSAPKKTSSGGSVAGGDGAGGG